MKKLPLIVFSLMLMMCTCVKAQTLEKSVQLRMDGEIENILNISGIQADSICEGLVFVGENADIYACGFLNPAPNQVVAGLCAIFLGGIGVQEFIVGRPGRGILCILFSWTGIPEIVGIFQGITWLCDSPANWQERYDSWH